MIGTLVYVAIVVNNLFAVLFAGLSDLSVQLSFKLSG